MECKINGAGCNNSCLLKENIQSQSVSGGCKDSGLDINNAGGQFWSKKSWENYTKRIKDMAANGCLVPNEVSDQIERITTEKRQSGELI